MNRDWALLERLSKLDDDALVGVDEVAALTGLARTTIQQRRVKNFPAPLPELRRLRWHLGKIRAWGRRPSCRCSIKVSLHRAAAPPSRTVNLTGAKPR